MRSPVDDEGAVRQGKEVHAELLLQTPVKARATGEDDALSFADRGITVERRLRRT